MTHEEQEKRHAEVKAILREAGAKIRALGMAPPYLIVLPDLDGHGFHSIGNGLSLERSRCDIARGVSQILNEAQSRERAMN